MSNHRLFLSTFALLLAASNLYAQDLVPWVHDLATAQHMAAARNQLVMVHFTADWCGPCQRLKKNVYNLRTFGHAVSQDFVPVKVDVGVNPEIAKRFNVAAWPTDVLMTAHGQELYRMVSPQTESEYLAILRQVSWRHKSAPAQQQVAQAGLAPRGDTPPSSSVTAPVANFLRNKFNRRETVTPGTPPLGAQAAAASQPYGPRPPFQNNTMQHMAPGMNGNFATGQTPAQLIPGATGLQPNAAQQTQFLQLQPPQASVTPGTLTSPQPPSAMAHTAQMTAPMPTHPTMSPSPGARATIPTGPTPAMPNSDFQGVASPQTGAAARPGLPVVAETFPVQQTPTATNHPWNTGTQNSGGGTAPIAANALVAASSPIINRRAAEMSNPSYVNNPMASFSQPSVSDATSPSPAPTVHPDAAAIAAAAAKQAAEATRKQFEEAAQRVVPETIYNEFVVNGTGGGTPVGSSAVEARGNVKIQVPTTGSDVTPAAAQSQPTPAEVSQAPRSDTPSASDDGIQIAMDGYCPVSLQDNNEWVAGDKRWGARHRGSVYLFQSAAAQQQFLANPDRYSPILAGYDPVTFVDQQQYVTGNRRHGIRFQDRIVLFSSEESLQKFSTNPERYLANVRQAMQSATMYR